MYTILEILAWRERDWIAILTFDMTVKKLLSYTKVYIKIHNQNTNAIEQYDLRQFIGYNLVNNETTIYNFIIGYNKKLPTLVLPIKSLDNVKKVRYHNLFDYGLRADKGLYTLNPLQDNIYYRPDIVITKGNTINDLEVYRNNALFLINGKVFFESYLNGNIYLEGGGTFIDKVKRNIFSFIGFTDIGGYTKQSITQDNVSVTVLSDIGNVVKVSIKFPNSIKGKLPLLVINRHLYLIGTVYFMPTEKEIILTLDKSELALSIPEESAESLGWIKPTTLSGKGYDLSSIDILKCLASPESAIILLNDNDISIKSDLLFRTGLPYKYTFYAIPDGIAIMEDNTVADYWVTEITSYGTEITTSTDKIKKPVTDTVPKKLLQGVSPQFTNFKSEVYECAIKTIYII